MAINKDKVRAAAQKYLQKGQIDKAIREFQRLVEDDPKDVRTLLKIGDLQTRKGDHAEATHTYAQVAAFYSEQGFYLKAVAVYKQILKIDPSLVDVNVRLAELYQQLGLLSEATNQYRQVCQLFEQQGRIDQCIAVLGKMVELDPENVASRIKLAELFAKQGRLDEARSEFRRCADYLKGQHRIDDYVKVAERMVYFDASDLVTARELANIYIQKGDARRALAKLQICFKADPTDIETLNLLANAFRGLGQVQKTVSVYKELARVHQDQGDMESYLGVMRRIQDLAPEDADAAAALADNAAAAAAVSIDQDSDSTPLARIVPAKHASGGPAPITEIQAHQADEDDDGVEIDLDGEDLDIDESYEEFALNDAAGAAIAGGNAGMEPGQDPAETIHRLMVETDIYIKYGLREKAIDHIRKIFVLDSGHRPAQEKHKDLLLDAGNIAGAVEALWQMVDTAMAAGLQEQARNDLEELLGIDPENARARSLLAEIAPEAAALGPVLGDASEDDWESQHADSDPVSAAKLAADDPGLIAYEPSPLAAEFDLDAPDADEQPEALPLGDEVGLLEDAAADIEADDLDPHAEVLGGDEHEPDGQIEEILPAAESPEEPVAPSEAYEPTPDAPAELTAPRSAPPKTIAGLADLDDLLASAVPPKKLTSDAPAPPSPSPAESAAETAPDASAEETWTVVHTPATSSETSSEGSSTPTSEDVERPEDFPQEFPDLTDEIDEVRFFMEQGLVEEAHDSLAALLAAHPEHPELQILQQEIHPEELTTTSESAPPFDELEPEPETFVLNPEGVAQAWAEDLENAAADDFQMSFTDVFDEFKRGVAEQVETTDYDTHYNLGIAYKEMGLLDDAIREFELAKDSPLFTIGALTLIGLCHLQLGNTEAALENFLAGLNSELVDPVQAVALRFEIGAAYEAMGKYNDATKFFKKVVAMDASFRDASSRLEATLAQCDAAPASSDALDALLEDPEADDDATGDAAGGGKISYV